MKNNNISLLAALGAIVAIASPASALSVRLTDTVSGPITIADNQVGDDLDPVIGELLYDSDVAATLLGGAFSLIEFSATTKPVIGSASLAELAIEVEVDSDFNAESLTVEVTETGFTLGGANTWSGLHAIGGFTAGSVTAQAYWDPGNVAFATTNSIGGPFSFGSTVDPFEAFAATLLDSEIGSNPFSMTTVLTITHLQGDELTEIASGAALSPVPVPATLPLLLGALGMAGFIARRKRRD